MALPSDPEQAPDSPEDGATSRSGDLRWRSRSVSGEPCALAGRSPSQLTRMIAAARLETKRSTLDELPPVTGRGPAFDERSRRRRESSFTHTSGQAVPSSTVPAGPPGLQYRRTSSPADLAAEPAVTQAAEEARASPFANQ